VDEFDDDKLELVCVSGVREGNDGINVGVVVTGADDVADNEPVEFALNDNVDAIFNVEFVVNESFNEIDMNDDELPSASRQSKQYNRNK
jgi:hypothetical protein